MSRPILDLFRRRAFCCNCEGRDWCDLSFTYPDNNRSEDCTESSSLAPLHDGFAAGLKGRTGVTWGSRVYCRNLKAAFRGVEKLCSSEFTSGAVLKEADD